jgi:drug/metabolite transporter (DMT)-like permease
MKSPLLGLLAGLAAASIWGGMYVISKVILEVIPPFSLISLRLILGMLTLYIVSSSWKGLNLKHSKLWGIFGAGLIGYGISLGFQFVGTKLSTASNGALLTSTTPAFALIFAAVLLGERITARRILALAVASLGVLAVIDPRSAELSPSLFWGNISLLMAGITWALYSVLVRKVTRDVDVLSTSLVAFAGGFPVCLPLSAWELSTQGLGEINLSIIGGVLFLGIISTALAMYLWNWAFVKLEAGIAALTFFAQPVVGAILGALFLKEAITPLFLVGGFMIGLGLVIASVDMR